MAGTVVFRADASQSIGYGHVMRSLAFADALREYGYSCMFVASAEGAVLADEVMARGHDRVILPPVLPDDASDAEATLHATGPARPSAAVVDHYGLGRSWEARIRAAGVPVLAIDDLARAHECDFLLDQNVPADENPYQDAVSVPCHFFLGPDYALLRREFARLRTTSTVRSALRSALVFFGGSDPGNETGKAVRGLLEAGRPMRIEVVIGAANPHRAEMEALCATQPENVRLHVQTAQMAALMADADLAIGAGGSASWERCCLRLPAIVSILADNQRGIAGYLHDVGAALNLGPAGELAAADYAAAIRRLDGARLAAMSQAAGRLVDGLGAERLAREFDQFIGSMQ